MVYLAPLIGAAALLSKFALAAPRPMPDHSSSSSSSSQNSNYNGGSNYDNSNDNSYNGNSNNYGGNNNYNGNGNSNSYGGNYQAPSYGSGSSNYNNYGGGYDDCVNQCIAQYGNNAYQYSPTPTSSGNDGSSNYGSSNSDSSNSSQSSNSNSSNSSQSSSSGSGGDQGSFGTNGVTHTVIVAPTQGFLRYVPFALNASVGDTIQFQWGANGHTVTHSSELLPCNKTDVNPFASGLQNKGFVYHQAVTSTNTTYFYCGAPSHCQKGMFGIINPPSNLDAPTSVSGMMQTLVSQNDDLKTLQNATESRIGQTGPAATWGGNIDIGKLAPEFQMMAAANVLYTRNVLAMNDNIWKNGSINLSSIGTNGTLMIPTDLDSALKQADATAPPPNNSAVAAVAGATNAPSTPSPTPSAPSTGSAGTLTSSKLLVAAVTVIATFLSL